jgi:hypothetical protein
MWREGSKVIFQVKVVERNEIAISNAAVELQGPWATKGASASAASSPAAGPSANGGEIQVPGFASSNIFASLKSGLSALPASGKTGTITCFLYYLYHFTLNLCQKY